MILLRLSCKAAVGVAIFAALYALIPILQTARSSLCFSTCLATTNGNYTRYRCAGKPHHSSWSSWWHPERNDGEHRNCGHDARASQNDWNILYHLGGNGPWVEKTIDVVDGGIGVPEGCAVEQVHMVGSDQMLLSLDQGILILLVLKMARHAERYPTVNSGKSRWNDPIRAAESLY